MKSPSKIKLVMHRVSMLMFFLLVSHAAQSNAEEQIIGTHIKYIHNAEYFGKGMKATLAAHEKQCKELNRLVRESPELRPDLVKAGLPTPWRVSGDVSKYGFYTMDEYYSADGVYKATYQNGYTMEPQICGADFKPFEKIEIYHRIKMTNSYAHYVFQYDKNKQASVWRRVQNAAKPQEFLSPTELLHNKKPSAGKDTLAGLSCDKFIVKGFELCTWYADSKRQGKFPSELTLMSKLGPDDAKIAEQLTFDAPINKSIFDAPSKFEDLSKMGGDLSDDDEDSPEEIARCIALNKKTGKNTCEDDDE